MANRQGTTSKEVGPGEVVVRVEFSGLCGTDLLYKHTDTVFGHEGTSVVELLGRDVKTLKT